MKQKPKIVALVPLRGGSKSIPYKNIKNIAGKPLCMWVLEEAIGSEMIDKVYVSTDSIKIKETVNNAEPAVQVIDRDPQLATDTASTESVMLDFAAKTDFDILVTIQATSPLTKAADFDNAIKYFLDNDLDSLFTGVRVKRFFWTDEAKPVNYDPLKRPRRQDFKGWIMENGAFYITKKNILEKYKCRLGDKTGYYEMEQESAFELDEPIDWEIIERFLLQRK
jgi:CMP-N-acetylneuraminic acid synthetase